jgi:thiol-disulfide isomerase/thioredoxin
MVGILIFFTGCTDNNTDNENTDDNPDNGSDDSNWLKNYTPVHTIGTGTDDFWIEFPTDNDNYGLSIQHFDWITNIIDNNCVLFVVHRTGCLGCKEQGELVISLAEKYGENIEFLDIDAVYDSPEEIQQMANDAYLYDPNGAPGYIALTGVFTYVEDKGEIKIGWHSWELDVEDSVMESWIKDAIYYFNMNNKG